MRKYIFIIILLIVTGSMLSAISYKPYAAMAQVQLETGLPNIPGGQLPAGQELPSYINYLFIFGLGLIAFLALGQMTIGGIQYILAAGNVAKVEDAKDTIQQALIGLGLLLVSYLLLNTINPDLVNLRNPNLTPTPFQGTTLISPTGAGGNWSVAPCNDSGFYENWQALPDTRCSSVPKDENKPYCCGSPTAAASASNIWFNRSCDKLGTGMDWVKLDDSLCELSSKKSGDINCCGHPH